MLYHLSKEQVDYLFGLHFIADFQKAEMLLAYFKTEFKVVKEILPPPLKALEEPLAMVFVAKYPETNFGCVYNEGALLVQCQYKGEYGYYCLSMPVDDDMAMISGRETFGFPKKLADKISLEIENDLVTGSVFRKGVEILKIECRLEKESDGSIIGDPIVDWDGLTGFKATNFLFKYFTGPDNGGFDYFPRLIREPVLFRPVGKLMQGKGRVILASTPSDPLGEVPVGTIVNMLYGKWHNTMLPGKVIGMTWNPIRFARNSFFKTDFAPTLLSSYDPKSLARRKEIFNKAKRY